ncbi:MAG: hypothetical protein NTY68_03305, partial [Candidatus Micrarchaeota archaeon]|nr:hypothetical protein [Candidatus Micrarchaeota archaeon]
MPIAIFVGLLIASMFYMGVNPFFWFGMSRAEKNLIKPSTQAMSRSIGTYAKTSKLNTAMEMTQDMYGAAKGVTGKGGALSNTGVGKAITKAMDFISGKTLASKAQAKMSSGLIMGSKLSMKLNQMQAKAAVARADAAKNKAIELGKKATASGKLKDMEKFNKAAAVAKAAAVKSFEINAASEKAKAAAASGNVSGVLSGKDIRNVTGLTAGGIFGKLLGMFVGTALFAVFKAAGLESGKISVSLADQLQKADSDVSKEMINIMDKAVSTEISNFLVNNLAKLVKSIPGFDEKAFKEIASKMMHGDKEITIGKSTYIPYMQGEAYIRSMQNQKAGLEKQLKCAPGDIILQEKIKSLEDKIKVAQGKSQDMIKDIVTFGLVNPLKDKINDLKKQNQEIDKKLTAAAGPGTLTSDAIKEQDRLKEVKAGNDKKIGELQTQLDGLTKDLGPISGVSKISLAADIAAKNFEGKVMQPMRDFNKHADIAEGRTTATPSKWGSLVASNARSMYLMGNKDEANDLLSNFDKIADMSKKFTQEEKNTFANDILKTLGMDNRVLKQKEIVQGVAIESINKMPAELKLANDVANIISNLQKEGYTITKVGAQVNSEEDIKVTKKDASGKDVEVTGNDKTNVLVSHGITRDPSIYGDKAKGIEGVFNKINDFSNMAKFKEETHMEYLDRLKDVMNMIHDKDIFSAKCQTALKDISDMSGTLGKVGVKISGFDKNGDLMFTDDKGNRIVDDKNGKAVDKIGKMVSDKALNERMGNLVQQSREIERQLSAVGPVAMDAGTRKDLE